MIEKGFHPSNCGPKNNQAILQKPLQINVHMDQPAAVVIANNLASKESGLWRRRSHVAFYFEDGYESKAEPALHASEFKENDDEDDESYDDNEYVHMVNNNDLRRYNVMSLHAIMSQNQKTGWIKVELRENEEIGDFIRRVYLFVAGTLLAGYMFLVVYNFKKGANDKINFGRIFDGYNFKPIDDAVSVDSCYVKFRPLANKMVNDFEMQFNGTTVNVDDFMVVKTFQKDGYVYQSCKISGDEIGLFDLHFRAYNILRPYFKYAQGPSNGAINYRHMRNVDLYQMSIQEQIESIENCVL